jgi:putative alpha-1,2-mannosidase
VYIESAELDGQPFTRSYLRHREIASGGTLTLQMSATPNESRGVAAEDRPYSVSQDIADP